MLVPFASVCVFAESAYDAAGAAHWLHGCTAGTASIDEGAEAFHGDRRRLIFRDLENFAICSDLKSEAVFNCGWLSTDSRPAGWFDLAGPKT